VGPRWARADSPKTQQSLLPLRQSDGCRGRVPEKSAAEIMQMLTCLKSAAPPFKRPSAKKMAGDFALYAFKTGARGAVGM
jgi:hypothetical protein